MNITVITGSHHRHGTSALLADEFVRGTGEAGHNLFRFDAAFEQLSPCLACDHCVRNQRECAQHDAMDSLRPHVLDADLVALVTPLYYYGMSAQLKTVIDRFYAFDNQLVGSNKRAILMATAYDADDWTMQALTTHYQTILRYLKWTDAGTLLAIGCGRRADIERTQFPAVAYQMGRQLA